MIRPFRPAPWFVLLGIALAMLTAFTAFAAAAAPPGTLDARMQRFRDGGLRGFALAALPDSGVAPYTDADFDDLAATGANVVRVAISLRKCRGCDRYDDPDAALDYVESVLRQGARHGFGVIVTLLPTPGFKQSDYWGDAGLQADIVRHWGRVANRLKPHAALLAYDLINEPVTSDARAGRAAVAEWQRLAAAIASELRRADPDTPLMVEPMPWGLPGSFSGSLPLDLAGVVYSFHLYAPHAFTHQGLPGYPEALAYPGQGWDRQRLSQALDEARRFADRHRVPMFVGEFSCVRWAPDGSCPRYLADAVSLFEAQGWGWTYHCWRCYQGWDAEVPAGVPQAQAQGRLPAERRPDTASMRLLKAAMARNARAAGR